MTVTTPAPGPGPTSTETPILQLRGVTKSFGAVEVLRDVDLDVRLGRVTALVGDNGAGKSTLIKGVAGIHTFDGGEYLFEGEPVQVTSPKQANALGIEVVYQDLALCDNLDIVDNLFLGREMTAAGLLDDAAMEKRARQTLAGLSVRTVKSVRQKVASLSGGQRQTVAIARSVLWNIMRVWGLRIAPETPCRDLSVEQLQVVEIVRALIRGARIVILDEPTAALGVAQTEQVLKLVRRLADNGLAVILISHNMNDVLAVADDIGVLYLGRMATQIDAKDVSHAQIVQLITSGSLATAPPPAAQALEDEAPAPDDSTTTKDGEGH